MLHSDASNPNRPTPVGPPEIDQAPVRHVDTLVIGGGVAGFRAALAAATRGEVLLITKDSFRESNTRYAQGGVAAVLGEDDRPDIHQDDTMRVGHGLCHEAAVAVVVQEAPARIRELVDWGGDFDRVDGSLHLALEGGHSRNRVVHAHGDATGAELHTTLERRVRSDPRIERIDYVFVLDLLLDDGRCVGAAVLNRRTDPQRILARNTILCTGGAGQIFRETTNPDIATGDGVAMAYRAGAAIVDMEFFQFHPTTLYVAGSARRLITEAVRGEGAHLVDHAGERFTFRYHPDGELAPRDVVSRAIVQHLAVTERPCVFLRLSHLSDATLDRFPGLVALCANYRIDAKRDLIPVHPSAHYMVGGVETDLMGATSVPSLYAAGEVAMTGLHGANRLASNSLIEGLVFGRRAGEHAAQSDAPRPKRPPSQTVDRRSRDGLLHVPDMLNSIRSLLWRRAGILRSGAGLREALRQLEHWSAYVDDSSPYDVAGTELLNQLTVARLLTSAATWREESRGTHHRTDHPEVDQRFHCHSRQIQGRDLVAQPIQ